MKETMCVPTVLVSFLSIMKYLRQLTYKDSKFILPVSFRPSGTRSKELKALSCWQGFQVAMARKQKARERNWDSQSLQ
jgi:hypothetical protein